MHSPQTDVPPFARFVRTVAEVKGGNVVANYYGKPRAYVAFQVRLVPELKERLMQRSFETGRSQVAIVNEALETYLSDSHSSSSPTANSRDD